MYEFNGKGESLLSIGVNNTALSKNEVFQVIEELRLKNLAVLGGDVYVKENKSMSITYDNWYCDRLKGESAKEYVNRSIEITMKYVEGYQGGGGVRFALVIDGV